MGVAAVFETKEAAEQGMTALERAGISPEKMMYYSKNVVAEADAEGTPSGADAVTQDPDSSGLVAADPGLRKILDEFGIRASKAKFYSEAYLHGDNLVLVKTNLFNRRKVKRVLRAHGAKV